MTSMLPMPEIGGEKAISQTDGRIAWEIAAEITPVKDILVRYGISPADFARKLKDPMFRIAIREAKSIWKSDLNVQQRIRMKAAFLVEDSILDVFAIIKNESQGATARLDAFKKLLETADIMPTKGANAPTAGAFKINIMLGDHPDQRVTIDGTTMSTLEAPSVA
jgi:hypothetical protein